MIKMKGQDQSLPIVISLVATSYCYIQSVSHPLSANLNTCDVHAGPQFSVPIPLALGIFATLQVWPMCMYACTFC